MPLKKCAEIEKNAKIKNKLLNIGIGYPIIGPTGPRGEVGQRGEKGEKGDKGDLGVDAVASNDGIFFTSFVETDTSEKMKFQYSLFLFLLNSLLSSSMSVLQKSLQLLLQLLLFQTLHPLELYLLCY